MRHHGLSLCAWFWRRYSLPERVHVQLGIIAHLGQQSLPGIFYALSTRPGGLPAGVECSTFPIDVVDRLWNQAKECAFAIDSK